MVGAGRAASAWLLACAVALPGPVAAQSTERVERDDLPFAWVLAGVDLDVREGWRVVVRAGHLGDTQSRLALGELVVLAQPALQVVLGHVHIAPTAPDVPRTSLTRGGVTWLPIRGRVTVDNRLLIERRAPAPAGSALRGRNRLRGFLSWPGGLPLAVVASLEVIAAADGLVENRVQIGGIRSFGRLTLEGAWLQRRLRRGEGRHGVSLIASWRIDD